MPLTLTSRKRPGQHVQESMLEYLSRAIGHLECEPGYITDDLKSVGALLDFFELWQAYGTDYWQGIYECIAEGDSPARARAFVKKHKLPKAWNQEINQAVGLYRGRKNDE